MSDLDLALHRIRARQATYREYADYYAGRHKLAFATEKFANAFGKLFAAFADNLCPVPIDSLADRLEVTSFGVEQGQKRQATDAWALWQANRMDRRAGIVHTGALLYGDYYLIVEPTDAGPRLWPNSPEWMTVTYDGDNPEVIAWAAKAWVNPDGSARMNLYYPDRIEKYTTTSVYQRLLMAAQPSDLPSQLPTDGAAFKKYRAPGEAWPLPNEYGIVPVFHFDNGVSELHNVIPLQDALNKSVADMLVSMEFNAYRQRWAAGIEVQVDEKTGKPIPPFDPGVDRIFAVANPDTKFGTFEQSDLSMFLKVQDSFRLEIARVSGTPLHHMMLMSDPPSGEALKTLESRFLKKVSARQAVFGNVWEDAIALALRMAGRASDRTRLSAQWKDAAPKSRREEAETQELLLRIHGSRRQSLKELGYASDEIESMLAAADALSGAAPPAEAV